jgi:uncharacterized BrkB/YihY/UPF0761 family membrane protein
MTSSPLQTILGALGLVVAAFGLSVASYVGAEQFLPGVVRRTAWEDGVSVLLVVTGSVAFMWCYKAVKPRVWGVLTGVTVAVICLWFALMVQLHFTCESYPTYIGSQPSGSKCEGDVE